VHSLSYYKKPNNNWEISRLCLLTRNSCQNSKELRTNSHTTTLYFQMIFGFQYANYFVPNGPSWGFALKYKNIFKKAELFTNFLLTFLRLSHIPFLITVSYSLPILLHTFYLLLFPTRPWSCGLLTVQLNISPICGGNVPSGGKFQKRKALYFQGRKKFLDL
jgi:hypothetical protein